MFFGEIKKIRNQKLHFTSKQSTFVPQINSSMNATVEDFLKYLKFERNYSDCTITAYRIALREYEDYVISVNGSFDPLAPSLNLARGWMVSMGKRKLSAASIKQSFCALRSFCRYLRKKGLLNSNPLTLLPTPKVAKSLPVWVREENMDSLIDDTVFDTGFIGQRDRLLLDMLYSTGMRRSEAAGLRDRDVDLSNRTIRIIKGKGNKERLVPFGQELALLIEKYREERNVEVGGPTEMFFTDEDGDSLSPTKVTRLAHKYLSQFPNLARKGAHVFRHSFATNMLAEGADLMAVKELLGHASLDSTEVYTHLTPQELLQNYEKAHPRSTR